VPKLVYSDFPIIDGDTISHTKLNAYFTSITTLVGTTKLDHQNFRAQAGIRNSKKAVPYALVPVTAVMRRGVTSTTSFTAFITWPQYALYPTGTSSSAAQDSANGTATEDVVRYDQPFKIVRTDVSYQGNAGATGGVTASTSYRQVLRPDLQVDNAVATTADTLTSSAYSETICDYVQVALAVSISGAGATSVSNVVVTLWLKVPHVA
jgi:hypothetical protein